MIPGKLQYDADGRCTRRAGFEVALFSRAAAIELSGTSKRACGVRQRESVARCCLYLRSRRGVVLFIVTIVIALVSLSAYAFAVLMQTEYRAAHLRGDQMQVGQVADSGSDFLRSLIAQPRAAREEWGGWQNNPTLFRDQIVDLDPLGTRAGRFSIVTELHSADDPQTRYQFGVEDTCSKLSLETLLRWDQQTPGSARAALLHLPGMNESLADALLDWIDPDDDTREFGAEAEFYQGLEPPRQPLNALPALLDQLLAIRGFTPQQLLGLVPIANTADGSLSEERTSPGGSVARTDDRFTQAAASGRLVAGISQAPWSHFLTVYSAQRNETADGEPRIDLNQADLTQLHRQLTQVFDESTANFVVALRRYGPTSATSGVNPGGPPPLVDLSGQAAYQFSSPLDVVDAHVAIPDPSQQDSSGQPRSTLYASPFSTQQGSSLEELVIFCDGTTIDTEPRQTGRINIQQAPREVLLGIPGLPPEAVDRLLSSRTQSRQDSTTRLHPVWLLVEGIVDLPTMKKLLPWMNTGGDVIRAEILAYYDQDSPWMRQEIVLDGTREGVPAVYYRDLRRMGLGFRWEQLARESSLPDAATPTLPADNLPGLNSSVGRPASRRMQTP